MTKEEVHRWLGAVVALIGSLGWLHESAVQVYGVQASLAAHQEDTKEELSQQRADMRMLRSELYDCRHEVGNK